jgi:hypothetical protein
MKRIVAVLTLTVLAVLVVAAPAGASRPPTYLEKISIMDAFNVPGRAFASSCVRIVVSTVDPRWAIVTSPIRPPKACVSSGEEGNGFALYRRATAGAIHWTHIVDGDTVPCQPPPAVRRDLFKTVTCRG